MALTNLVALLAIATVSAQPVPGGAPPSPPPPPGAAPSGVPPGGPGPGPGDQVALLTTVLELSAAQQAAWKSARTELEATVTPLAEQARALHDEVRQMLDAGGADATVIGGKVIAAQALEVRIRTAAAAGRDAFKALLTADQAEKLAVVEAVQEAMRAVGPGGGPPRR